jgi:hypothetical protein
MDKYQREANPRELTEEEIKTVAGGTNLPISQPNPGWSNQGGDKLNGDFNQWREGSSPVTGLPNEKQPK